MPLHMCIYIYYICIYTHLYIYLCIYETLCLLCRLWCLGWTNVIADPQYREFTTFSTGNVQHTEACVLYMATEDA